MSDEINELAGALANAQGEMGSAEKDKVNPYFKSQYASLDSLQKATRPILSKYGLSICQLPIQSDGGILLETHLMHSSGQQLVSNWFIPVDKDIQKIGSYLTYVKRYAWSAICGISADEEDDGNSAAQPVAQKRTTAPADDVSQKPKTPTTPAELLAVVNNRVLVSYNDVQHLFSAIREESTMDNYSWPNANDLTGWRNAYKLAKDHADKKSKGGE